MGSSDQAKPRSALKLLWEGLELPITNFRLLHPLILLSFLSSYLLFLFTYLCLTPLVADLTTKSILISKADPKSPEFSLLMAAFLKDLKEIGLIEVVVHIVSFIVNSLVAIVTVYLLSIAYSSKIPSKLKELFAGLNWSLVGRAMITQLYVAFLNLVLLLIAMLTTGVVSFFHTYFHYSPSNVGWMVIFALGVIVTVLAVYLYLYLFVVVTTSLVVSVVEEGCYGLAAITKASKLIGGRRKQAILIAFIESVAITVFSGGWYMLVTAHAPPVKMAQLAVGFGTVAIGVVANMFVWSVHTVYYYECSRSPVEGIVTTEDGFKYNPVPTQVDEAVL